MNEYKKILDSLKTLTPLEELFYTVYKLHLDIVNMPKDYPAPLATQMDADPQAKRIFMEIADEFSNKTLKENTFIRNSADIDVNIHVRYLPAYEHSHKFYELQYVLCGNCTQTINGTKIYTKTGDICFISPEISHTLEVFSHDTIVVNILVRKSTFRATFINLLGRDDIISDFFTKSMYKAGASPYILCKTNGEPILENLIRRMLKESAAPLKFSEFFMKTMLELFFIELLRMHEFHFIIAESTENVENENIMAIMRYIQRNFQNITLSEAAIFFNYSESHLSRMIKKFSGQTFSEIIKTIRVQYSAKLLLENKMSIQEIVTEVGYTDNSHFYRVFKQYYKMTPLQYRDTCTKCDD